MSLDPLEYRAVIGGFATGVTVVTAFHAGEPYAMTANSVTSVSLEPTLLLVCFMKGSRTGLAVRESGWFAVNILDDSQEGLSRRFASPELTTDFDGVEYVPGMQGAPLLSGGLGNVQCRVREVVEGGDHDIVIGDVLDASAPPDGDPLLFFRGKYRRMAR